MGYTCSTGKKVFLTLTMAEDALIETRIKFDYANNYGPVAVYRCDDCGYFHLTSQGTMNQRLADYIKSGALQKANRWLDKFK